MKALLFSDIHFGLNLDNPIFYQINLDLFEWIKNEAKNREIETIIILGDVFHNRKNINLLTLKNCFDCFSKLNSFKIHILTGNHDCYYLDNSEHHSLDFFKGWNNIEIYDKISYRKMFNRQIVFIPWSGKYLTEKVAPCDLALGHFELTGFEYGSALVKDGTSTAIFEGTPLVLSGHFHKYQKQIRPESQIIYLGSPYQHNWGELEEKYIHVLDFNTMELESIKNEISPKHIKITKVGDVKKLKQNQFVKLILNEDNQKLKTLVLEKSPLDIQIELNLAKEIKATVKEFKSVDALSTIDEFINGMVIDDDLKKVLLAKNNLICKEVGLI